MGKIHWGRVILGGLVAGVVINISEFLVNGVLLGDEWARAMEAIGRPAGQGIGQMVSYAVWGFVVGIFAVWLYSAIRPRYGAGPKTAFYAGVAVWLLGYLMSALAAVPMDLFPTRLLYIGVAVGLVEILVGTLLGAYLYREGTAGVIS